jgi:hypothetical protein
MRQVNKEKLSITLDYEVYKAIADLAEEESRSLSQQINKILKDHIKDQEGKK